MNIAIILAGGNGSRFLSETTKFPKEFYEFCRNEVISSALDTFNSHPLIDEIIVVCNIEYIKKTEEIVKANNFSKVTDVIAGGVSRQTSVYSAIHHLTNHREIAGNPNIIIHDAARVLVSNDVITKNIEALENHQAVATYVPMNETLIEIDNGILSKRYSGGNTYYIQSPQSFKFDTLRSAHRYAQTLGNQDAYDDSELMKLVNQDVFLVEGNPGSRKITTEEDLIFIKKLLEVYKS